jgi:Pyridoxamine 5'-phosphate oxidase
LPGVPGATPRTPARLAYTWMDGSPRVVPIWFHWTGDQFVLGSPPKAPKLRALAADPRAALTIDDNTWPHKVLLVRGHASVELLDDVSPEYELAATRYFGAGTGPGLGQYAQGKAHGPYRHYTGLGRNTRLPNPVPQRLDALGTSHAHPWRNEGRPATGHRAWRRNRRGEHA